jgi:single-strand DNA-binding protein
MKNTNVFILEGRLTRDPEKRQAGGTDLYKSTIANNRDSKDKKIVNFVDIEAWGNVGKPFDYLKKGQPVRCVGELKTGSYEKDGVTIKTFGLLCHSVEFVSDGKKSDTQQGAQSGDFEDDIPF